MLNLGLAYVICTYATAEARQLHGPDKKCFLVSAIIFGAYVLIVAANYFLLKKAKQVGGTWATSALWAPIALLVAIKYIPLMLRHGEGDLGNSTVFLTQYPQIAFVGLSYMSFRLCSLASEVQSSQVEMPSLWDYLSFAFFIPTLSVGPISPFHTFIGSLRNPDRTATPLGRSVSRLVVGLTKFVFLATLLSQFSYRALLLDGHPHAKLDLSIAILAYPMYLYCNFSGFCDMAVGVAGIMGISVMENFNRPFASRNLQEFWNNWHISLSSFLRDMMFTPLVKILARRFPQHLNHIIAFSILSVFVVIGVWHGTGLNFALFGLSQGIGVGFVHYGTNFLKKRLGKTGFNAYRKNPAIYALACGTTYVYFGLSLFLFANTIADMRTIIAALI